MRAVALAWLVRSHGGDMDDGELPAMIEMVKKGRGNRVERFAVKLVLGEHLARPCLLRDPAGLCYYEC